MISLEITAQRKATGEKGPATELEPGTYTLSRSFSHELSASAVNPSSTIALCSGCRCATRQRPFRTYASRLAPSHVMVVGSEGDYRVA